MSKVRTTITIDEDLLARFQAVADQERRSLSSLLNTWLEQCVEAAEFVGDLAEGQRGRGVKAMRELFDRLTLAQASVADDLVANGKARAGALAERRPARPPRLVIRGVNTKTGGDR